MCQTHHIRPSLSVYCIKLHAPVTREGITGYKIKIYQSQRLYRIRIRVVYWWNAETTITPGPVIRELVPSSHQRSELSNTILCIFSGWDQRIGEGIPIPDSLGEEATFINICIGNGSLKCHRVLIPTTSSFGDKVICWYTGFTFKTFI